MIWSRALWVLSFAIILAIALAHEAKLKTDSKLDLYYKLRTNEAKPPVKKPDNRWEIPTKPSIWDRAFNRKSEAVIEHKLAVENRKRAKEHSKPAVKFLHAAQKHSTNLQTYSLKYRNIATALAGRAELVTEANNVQQDIIKVIDSWKETVVVLEYLILHGKGEIISQSAEFTFAFVEHEKASSEFLRHAIDFRRSLKDKIVRSTVKVEMANLINEVLPKTNLRLLKAMKDTCSQVDIKLSDALDDAIKKRVNYNLALRDEKKDIRYKEGKIKNVAKKLTILENLENLAVNKRFDEFSGHQEVVRQVRLAQTNWVEFRKILSDAKDTYLRIREQGALNNLYSSYTSDMLKKFDEAVRKCLQYVIAKNYNKAKKHLDIATSINDGWKTVREGTKIDAGVARPALVQNRDI